MLRILLADSDTDNVKNMRAYIKNAFPEARIVAGITDRTADINEAVKKWMPQLIITDIRFFGTSGYQAVKDIHERFPDIRLIIYGTYNDGEYMKRMLEQGVIDYIFKPVRPAELQRCINAALEYLAKLEEEKRQDTELISDYNNKLYFYKNIFLTSLVIGHINNTNEIKHAFNYFGLELAEGYTVFVIRIDHFKKIILTLDEMEKHLMAHRMLITVQKKLSGTQAAAFSTELNSVTVLAFGDKSMEETVALCEEIKDAILREISIRVTIGIGRTYKKETDIYISCMEAQSALRYRFQIGYHTVIPIHYVEPHNCITYRYPIEKEERLVYTAAIGEYDYCRVLLTEIFAALRECGELPDKLLPKIVMDILISINRYLSEKNIQVNNNFLTFFPTKDVLELKDLDAAFNFLDKALKSFCGFIVSFYEEGKAKLVEAAKAYMKSRYYESFSLQRIAVELGSTPEYLNKVFFDAEKKTLMEYNVGIRLAEAKKLIRETDYDDDIVAVKVGYDDARHFRSVFKQYENLSTSDYRRKYSLFSDDIRIGVEL